MKGWTMKLFHKNRCFLLLCLSAWTDAEVSRLHLNKNQWKLISPNVAFQSNNYLLMDNTMKEHATNTAIDRMLNAQQQSTTTNLAYAYQLLDSSADYNEYQLAWHLLGFYVDCNTVQSYCSRYAMYAVYANEDYAGGGIGEYYYYDAKSGEWVCYNSDGCKSKMDCHLPDTHWKMLGVFKINNISGGDGWMEQLFKHQGVCVWGEDTYKFASNMRERMPRDCTSTKQTLASGQLLYYHVKPERNGNITLGLYTDKICSQEYNGEEEHIDVFDITGNEKSYFALFNAALDTWKQCQPCISYSLNDQGYDCTDSAGYTNCNQCMKFSNKAGCKIADRQEIEFAARQNGLVSFELNGIMFGDGGIGRDGLENTVSKKMKAPSEEKFPTLLLFSFSFLLASIAFFSMAIIKNFKLYSLLHKNIFCEDDISTARSENLIKHCDSKVADDYDEDDLKSTISRISSKTSSRASFVRTYQVDDEVPMYVGAFYSSPTNFHSKSNNVVPNEANADQPTLKTQDTQTSASGALDVTFKNSEISSINLKESDCSEGIKAKAIVSTYPSDVSVISFGSASSKSGSHRNDRQGLEKLKTNAERMCNIGNDLLASGHNEDALKAYSRAIRLSPDGPQTHIFYSKRAAASLFLLNYRDAADDARCAIALQPTYAKAHVRLGQALHFTKDFEKAIDAYEEALKYAKAEDIKIYRSYLAKAKKELQEQPSEQPNKNSGT